MSPDTNQPSSQPVPNDSGQQPNTPPPQAGIPVFQNPLARGYQNNTAQLPDLTQGASSVAQPQQQPQPQPQPQPINTPAVDQATQQVSQQPQYTQDTFTSLDDAVSIIPEPTPIAPAPVRLAPVPKAGATPNVMPTSNVAPPPVSAAPSPSVPKSNVPRRSPIRFVIAGVIVFLILGGVLLGLRAYVQRPSPTATPTTAASPVRDTAEKQLASGYERLDTPCYTVQIPTGPRVDINKDCQLSAFYGSQKVSSVVVSTFRDFDFVAQENTNSSPSPSTSDTRTGQRFDSKKIMEALITNATTGKAITARQDIKIGNIDAVKVVGAAQAGGDPVYINVFIVLPETDQHFGDKNFIAFTVTGAYNDSYSRKSFDHVLETWQWK